MGHRHTGWTEYFSGQPESSFGLKCIAENDPWDDWRVQGSTFRTWLGFRL